MKTIFAFITIAILLTSNAQAAMKNCFNVSVSGKLDISLMMASLNKANGVTYKLESFEDSKVKNATFHIISLGEKNSKILFNKIMDTEGSFQKYINVTSGEFIEGENACNYYSSIETDI